VRGCGQAIEKQASANYGKVSRGRRQHHYVKAVIERQVAVAAEGRHCFQHAECLGDGLRAKENVADAHGGKCEPPRNQRGQRARPLESHALAELLPLAVQDQQDAVIRAPHHEQVAALLARADMPDSEDKHGDYEREVAPPDFTARRG